MRFVQRAAASVFTAAGAALLIAGCGGSGTHSTAGGSAAATPAGASPAASGGTAVTATETEFAIRLSTTSFTPGTYTFTVHNGGKFPHNLKIKGPGVDGQGSQTVQPGDSAQLTVTLQQGSYELWCAVDSHKDKGMDMTITVG